MGFQNDHKPLWSWLILHWYKSNHFSKLLWGTPEPRVKRVQLSFHHLIWKLLIKITVLHLKSTIYMWSEGAAKKNKNVTKYWCWCGNVFCPFSPLCFNSTSSFSFRQIFRVLISVPPRVRSRLEMETEAVDSDGGERRVIGHSRT